MQVMAISTTGKIVSALQLGATSAFNGAPYSADNAAYRGEW